MSTSVFKITPCKMNGWNPKIDGLGRCFPPFPFGGMFRFQPLVKFNIDTLPKTNIAMENPPFWWYLQGNMGIFMGELLVSGRVLEMMGLGIHVSPAWTNMASFWGNKKSACFKVMIFQPLQGLMKTIGFPLIRPAIKPLSSLTWLAGKSPCSIGNTSTQMVDVLLSC